jgi:hypothetical protein
VSGLAIPENMPPAASPNHQTASAQMMVPASAARADRRQSRPRPSASWIAANAVLYSAGCVSISWPAPVTEPAMNAGLPMAAGSMTDVAKPRPNMNG